MAITRESTIPAPEVDMRICKMRLRKTLDCFGRDLPSQHGEGKTSRKGATAAPRLNSALVLPVVLTVLHMPPTAAIPLCNPILPYGTLDSRARAWPLPAAGSG